MNKDLLAIFEYLEREKGIKRDFIVSAIEEAMIVAARKGQQGMNNVTVKIDPKSGEISAVAEKEIVEVIEYPSEEILLEEARELDPNCQLGDWIDVDVEPENFGRIAAQVAKQLISQKIRGAERDVIYEEYRHRIGELISGTIRRITKGHTLVIDLGKVEGILPGRFYPKSETYNVGDKVLALLYDVQDTESGGAEVILSRSHPEFVSALFMQEVPEVSDGTVHIDKIVRDAGFRTKLAVSSSDTNVDAVGACVGVRGTRVKNIIRELNNEKIDVIPFSDDPITLMKNAFSPSEIKKIDRREVKKADTQEIEEIVSIVIDDEDYPSVLGKKGNNVRLTSALIGIKVEVHKITEHQKELAVSRKQLSLSDNKELDRPIEKIGDINKLVVDNIVASGMDTPRKLLETNASEIAKQADISIELAETILEAIRKQYEQ